MIQLSSLEKTIPPFPEQQANSYTATLSSQWTPGSIITDIISKLPTPSSPTKEQEITYISGINENGKIAATSYATWSGREAFTYVPIYRPLFSSVSKFAENGFASRAGEGGGTVSYSFDPNSNWTAGEKNIFSSSLDLWSSVANIKFKEDNTSQNSQLTFIRGEPGEGAYETEESFSFSPLNGTKLLPVQQNATVHISTDSYGWKQLDNFSYAGGYGVLTVIHEIGHALGLGHGGPYNGNVEPYQQYSAYDNRQWTIMSYNDPENTNLRYADQNPVQGTSWNGHYTNSLQQLDIQAIQRLYGVAKDTPLSGGQIFGFNTNIEGNIRKFFDFTINKDPILTLWDKGDNNTLDLSGYNTPATVNLNAGTFSSFNNMTNNLAIAVDTRINNAIGGGGDDRFYVNNQSDFIDGKGGENVVIFPQQASAYTLALNGTNIQVATKDTQIVSTLQNIQSLQFNDQTLSISNLFPTLAATFPAGDFSALVLNDITQSQNYAAVQLPDTLAQAQAGFSTQTPDILFAPSSAHVNAPDAAQTIIPHPTSITV